MNTMTATKTKGKMNIIIDSDGRELSHEVITINNGRDSKGREELEILLINISTSILKGTTPRKIIIKGFGADILKSNDKLKKIKEYAKLINADIDILN